MPVINACAQDAVDRAEPLTVAAAYAQCRDAALAESAIGAIGLEIESHLVDLDHVADPVPWERVEAIAAAVGRVAPSTAVTVEPGGQIELSGPPDAGVGPAVARLRYESTGARLALAECRLGLAHAGADPARPSLRVNPRPRYRAMEQHFAATGRGPGRAGHDELDRRLAGQSPGRPHGRVAGQGRAGLPARSHPGGDRGEFTLAARPRYGLEVRPAAGLGAGSTRAPAARCRAAFRRTAATRCSIAPQPGPGSRCAPPGTFVRGGDDVLAVGCSVPFSRWTSGAVKLGNRPPTAADLETHLSTLFPRSGCVATWKCATWTCPRHGGGQRSRRSPPP
jgi:glutamate--cysteine ligase